jgi:hypothetical protein
MTTEEIQQRIDEIEAQLANGVSEFLLDELLVELDWLLEQMGININKHLQDEND